MNATTELALSDPQRAVLDVLRLGRGARPVDISRLTGARDVTLATLSRLGFVEQRHAGGLGSLYHLTPAGRQAAHTPEAEDAFNEGPAGPGAATTDTDKENTIMSATEVKPDPKTSTARKAGKAGGKNAAAAKPAPPVEDVTGKAPAPKVSKTKIAREAAINVLKKAGEPMKMGDIVEKVLADPKVKDAGVARGTVTAQITFELAEKEPRIERTARATYALKK